MRTRAAQQDLYVGRSTKCHGLLQGPRCSPAVTISERAFKADQLYFSNKPAPCRWLYITQHMLHKKAGLSHKTAYVCGSFQLWQVHILRVVSEQGCADLATSIATGKLARMRITAQWTVLQLGAWPRAPSVSWNVACHSASPCATLLQTDCDVASIL